jgi:hypothetical protein
MKVATRLSRFASLLMLEVLLCSPLIQPSAAGLLPAQAENVCCGSCGQDAPSLSPGIAENSAVPDHAYSGAQTGQCDVCPSSARGSSGASILLPHPHRLAPAMAQMTHVVPLADDPATPLHDGGLFRPPRLDAACTG